MKASVSPRTLWVIVGCLAAVASLSAQDVIVQKDNQRREGQILGVSDGKVRIKIGPAETTVALDQVASVTKDAPKGYEDGLGAWKAGNATAALAALKPIADSFRGLPASWAERAAALLGDIYLAQNQLPNAEAAFAAFQKAYPNSTSASDVGLARLAIEKKDFATAKAKLTPIVEAAAGTIQPAAGQGAALSQAFFLMGQVRESEGALPEALQNYLSTVTLFSEDSAAVAKAQERANFLIAEKQVVVP